MLESLANRSDDVVVRKFDINRPGVTHIDFESPLAQQHVQNGIPQFAIYDGNGKLLAQGNQAGNEIVQMCLKAGMTEDDLRKAGIIR